MTMSGRNFIVKKAEIFSEHNANNFNRKFLTVTDHFVFFTISR